MTMRDPQAVRTVLGEDLRLARFRKGMTQGAVARAIGIQRVTLNNKEAARQGISITQFLDWCDVLGVDPAQVIAKVAEKTRP
jgi:transcriptional regulator with XRE-family HTH domain